MDGHQIIDNPNNEDVKDDVFNIGDVMGMNEDEDEDDDGMASVWVRWWTKKALVCERRKARLAAENK